jgi:hypothetical protein
MRIRTSIVRRLRHVVHSSLFTDRHLGQRPGAGVQGAGGGPLQSMPEQYVGHTGEQPRAMTITHKQRIAPPARLCYNSA